jgi:tetratricopeptide (TPR) repeat protein
MLLINFFKKASDNTVLQKSSDAFFVPSLFGINFIQNQVSHFMRVRCIIIALMWCFVVPTFGQDSTLKIENLKSELKNELSLEDQLNIHEKLVEAYLSKDKDSAAVYSGKLYQLAMTSESEAYEGIALYFKGRIAVASNTKALDYFLEAKPILETYNSPYLSDVYYYISDIYSLYSDFPEALEFCLKSLQINTDQGNELKELRDMSFLGYLHDRMYEFRESILWNRKALKIAERLKDANGQALCNGRIGIAYDELAELDNFNRQLFDSALYHNLKAARFAKEAGNLGFLRSTYSNIGNSYSKLKQYDKAEEYTIKSLEVPGFEDRKGVTLVNLGKIYLETGRYNESKKILDSAMQNTITYGTRKYQFEAYYRFHELDLKLGNHKSALEHYKAYKEIEDELLNETKTRQIAEMSERFKSVEKEKELAKNRATIAEKDLNLQQKNIQIYGLAIAAIIFSILGYLFYNQQKLKNKQLKKENELKDAIIKIETQNKLQEQRLRISRDLHDNIGSQLTFIISSIDNLKYGFDIKNNLLNNKLASISSFTKETIYELRDTIWAMNKNEITFEDLQTRISNFIDKDCL